MCVFELVKLLQEALSKSGIADQPDDDRPEKYLKSSRDYTGFHNWIISLVMGITYASHREVVILMIFPLSDTTTRTQRGIDLLPSLPTTLAVL